ncbi:MAG: uroporphyrinogen decarboxylase [Deltaproteobacteria bacterium]|jgi:uroporphyrinogen decarboxylase|nr:uroporphyrinogen decarboxylase [Deltaproteobacteria bacterium]
MENKRELISQTFNFSKTSRVPVGFWFHFLSEAESGDILEDPHLLVRNLEGHRRFLEAFQPDLVKIMTDGFFRYPMASNIPGYLSLGGIQKLTLSHPWIERQLELATKVRSLDPKNTFFYNIFSPSTFLRFLLGFENYFSLLNSYTSIVREILLEMGDLLGDFASLLIKECYLDGIYLSVQNPNIFSYSSEFYAQNIAPGELLVLEKAREAGGKNILHICGYAGIKNRLNDFREYPAQAISYAANVENVSLKEARDLFSGKVIIGGFPNTPGSLLTTGSEEEIRNFTKGLIKDFGPGLIVGADCTVPNDISLERLSWVREAARISELF